MVPAFASDARSSLRLPEPPTGLGAMRAGGPIIGIALVVVALLGVLARNVAWRPLAMLTPTGFVLAAGADCATAIILLAFGRYASTRASTQVLAAVYGVSAAAAVLSLLYIPLDAGGSPLLDVGRQAMPYALVALKLATGAAAFAYARLRRGCDDPTVRRSIATTLAAVAAIVAVGLAAIVWADGLPAIVAGSQFTPAYRLAISPFVMAICALGALVVLRLPESNAIDRAFAYALLAVVAEGALTAFGGQRYTVPWYLALLVYTSGQAFVLIAAIHTLVRSRETLRDTEVALVHSQSESKRHAERIRALWQIAASAQSDEERLQAVLDIGARTLRPGRDVFGYVSHLEDTTVVVDAVSGETETVRSSAIAHFGPGFSLPLERTIVGEIFARGHSMAWSDLREFAGRDMAHRQAGWQSLIGAPMRIGCNTYFLIFASTQPMNDAPFAEDDIAYLDVLASFVAHQYSERQQRERIRFHIEHDTLTGLKNRAQFRAELRRAVAGHGPVGVAFVDLDRFRAINETSGHLIADELLVEVAFGLDGVDERDIVARVAADEFAVVLADVASADDLRARVAVYADVFAQPFHTGDRDGTRTLTVSASIGAAHFPGDATSADELLRCADAALELAKSRGGNGVVLYDPAMVDDVRQRHLKSVELADAIEGGELSLVYQPTFALDTCATIGAEALVRWNHPARGLLLPADFLEFAERNGLIGRLSRWVIHRVISDLSSLPAIPAGFRCYFNLATAQIDDLGFIAELEARLRLAPRLANHLGVEITETAAISSRENSMYALERFRKLGLRIAIDDFGTGYSSLSYLKRLPIDVIKIDRSFVTGVPDDAKDVALCELLLQIANRFDLVPLAEGIETAAQLRWLRDHGCDVGQGFLIAKPMPFDDLARRLRESAALVEQRRLRGVGLGAPQGSGLAG